MRRQLELGIGVALLVYGCGCTEHAYAHDVQGSVLDTEDRPLGGASVTRVKSAATSGVFGASDIYQRTTSPDGRFAFTYDGHGDEPAPTSTWHLRADAPGCHAGSATVAVPLDSGTYRAHGVVLRVRCDSAP